MYSRQKEIMQSNIEFAEFKNRLLKHTAILNIDILGTPLIGVAMFFNPSEKKFCGQVSSNSFVITTYNTLFPIPYKIEGEMCAESDSTTNVKYVVKPIWLLYLWIRIIPIFCILFLACMLIGDSDLIPMVIIFGLVFVSVLILNIYLSKRKLKKFELDFKKTFEIN